MIIVYANVFLSFAIKETNGFLRGNRWFPLLTLYYILITQVRIILFKIIYVFEYGC